jgi:TatD DNase family protein
LRSGLPYINIHTHLKNRDEGICIYNQYPEDPIPGFPISIGIHPWNIKKYNIPETLDIIRKNAPLPNVMAIGECGLDKLTDVQLQEQEQIFIEQIRIAESVKKPLIIHCVKAFDDLIRIKKEIKPIVPFIVHGYNNNLQIMEQLVKHDLYFSFGKALLKEGSNAQKTLTAIPPSRFFLETDDADISINSIFEKAAVLKNMGVEALKEQITINFKLLFNYG